MKQGSKSFIHCAYLGSFLLKPLVLSSLSTCVPSILFQSTPFLRFYFKFLTFVSPCPTEGAEGTDDAVAVAPPAPPTSTDPHDASSMTSQAPSPGVYTANGDNHTLRCLRTGLVFPSDSTYLKLLPSYDDGLEPPVALYSEGNPVFCRICREGLHEDADPSADEGNESSNKNNNPLMAPCGCVGSMAFVHYLCVEQWRCRSRHPDANNGLNCETCSKPYALPPPTRQQQVPSPDNDMLEAMPPHVIAALREPHFWWRLSAGMVRRRWLRPVAPIVMSPLVSLYCRARRLLKKRGVSRRRWACSLCRRRARWKCVRCLRSYYCSRHCQNVSWHIVHKHVCYKPARFWWSVVFYGALLLMAVPGVLNDFLVYDLILFLIPASFYIVAILGGGLATLVKRSGGVDLRGRILESVVVSVTLWVMWVSNGLVWAFFGDPSACVGIAGEVTPYVPLQSRVVFQWLRLYFVFLDQAMVYNTRLSRLLCPSTSDGSQCFAHTPVEDPIAVLVDNPKCGGDYSMISWLWFAAGTTLLLSTIWKKRRRNRDRVHQD